MSLTLHLRVVEATDIPKMDTFGKTDPYVVFWLGSTGQKNRTKYMKNTHTPIWNEDFSLVLTKGLNDTIYFEMWDKDVSRDDLFGKLEINISPIQLDVTHDAWFNAGAVRKVKKGGRFRFMIHVSSGRFSAFQAPRPTYAPVSLTVRICEAMDIPKMDTFGKTDGYVVFQVSGTNQKFKTKVIDNNMNPKWNEDFTVSLPSSNSQIALQFWDKDVIKDDLISTTDINLALFELYKCHDLWINLSPAPRVNKGGKLHMLVELGQPGSKPFSSQGSGYSVSAPYGQPSYASIPPQAPYGQSSYPSVPPQAPYGQPSYPSVSSQPPYGQPTYSVPPQAPYGQPSYPSVPSQPPNYSVPPQSPYGQPSYASIPPQPSYGQPSYSVPPQSPYGQPSYASMAPQPSYGQPSYSVPPQAPYGQPMNAASPRPGYYVPQSPPQAYVQSPPGYSPQRYGQPSYGGRPY